MEARPPLHVPRVEQQGTEVDRHAVEGQAHLAAFKAPPAFAGGNMTICFRGDPDVHAALGFKEITSFRPLVRYDGVANRVVRNAFREAGFQLTKGSAWNVMWGAAKSPEEYKSLLPFQRINHFPGTWELGRKDRLYRSIARMRRLKGAAFDFVPPFYVLPDEWTEFRSYMSRNPKAMYIRKPVASSRGRGVRMVVNPNKLPRNKEFMVQRYIENPLLVDGRKFDLRLYVVVTCLDPLRVYVYEEGLVRFASTAYSTDSRKKAVHITNYTVQKKLAANRQRQANQDSATMSGAVNADGGAPGPEARRPESHESRKPSPNRRASSASLDGEEGLFAAHLARQESGPASAASADVETEAYEADGESAHGEQRFVAAGRDPGSPEDRSRILDSSQLKWTFRRLREHLKAQGIPWKTLWDQMLDIVARTVIAVEGRMSALSKVNVPHHLNCFEVYGFDIMFDDRLRGWLIEVNTGPSLATGSAVDREVKTPMVRDLMHLVGVPVIQKGVFVRQMKVEREARLSGLARTASRPDSRRSQFGADSSEPGTGPPSRPGTSDNHRFPSASSSRTSMASERAPSRRSGRRVQDAAAFDFTDTPTELLPESVLEMEAEDQRRGRFIRAFPRDDEPGRHQELFETKRYENILLQTWLISKTRARTGRAHGTRKPGQSKARTQKPAPTRTSEAKATPRQRSAARALSLPRGARSQTKGLVEEPRLPTVILDAAAQGSAPPRLSAHQWRTQTRSLGRPADRALLHGNSVNLGVPSATRVVGYPFIRSISTRVPGPGRLE
ncbi:unnamed protein product [Pedinophyceae sp. YPF-701]|nr:unnamed protein product [Pedinophyceae sp. YPF-701]